jgi:hypothetical protein
MAVSMTGFNPFSFLQFKKKKKKNTASSSKRQAQDTSVEGNRL